MKETVIQHDIAEMVDLPKQESVTVREANRRYWRPIHPFNIHTHTAVGARVVPFRNGDVWGVSVTIQNRLTGAWDNYTPTLGHVSQFTPMLRWVVQPSKVYGRNYNVIALAVIEH